MQLAFDIVPCGQEVVHAGNEFVELKELGLPDRVLAMGWCGDSICLGFHRECDPHTPQPQSFLLHSLVQIARRPGAQDTAKILYNVQQH